MMGATVKLNTGGLVKTTGLATVHAGELMLDNQAATIFKKGVEVLTSSQALEQFRMGSGPTIINNNNMVDNSQTNSSTSQTTIKAQESPKAFEPTYNMAMSSYSFN